MAEPGFERVFDELDARLDAALARQDEEAGDDLAIALSHDVSLELALSRSGWAAVGPQGTRRVVTEFGGDYLSCSWEASGRGRDLLPLSRAILARDDQVEPPRRRENLLLSVLRDCARRRVPLRLLTKGGVFSGILLRASEDHVFVRTSTADVVVSRDALEEIRIEADEGWGG